MTAWWVGKPADDKLKPAVSGDGCEADTTTGPPPANGGGGTVTPPAPPTIPDPPTPTTPPTVPPAGPAATNKYNVAMRYAIQPPQWADGYNADLHASLPEYSDREVHWTVTWEDPNAVSIARAWGMTCVVESPLIKCVSDGYGHENLQWEADVYVGVQVVSRDGMAAPTNPTLTVTSDVE